MRNQITVCVITNEELFMKTVFSSDKDRLINNLIQITRNVTKI